MKETGVVAFKGGTKISEYKSISRKLLGILKSIMGDRPSGWLHKKLNDGTIIKISSTYGVDRVKIVPPGVSTVIPPTAFSYLLVPYHRNSQLDVSTLYEKRAVLISGEITDGVSTIVINASIAWQAYAHNSGYDVTVIGNRLYFSVGITNPAFPTCLDSFLFPYAAGLEEDTALSFLMPGYRRESDLEADGFLDPYTARETPGLLQGIGSRLYLMWSDGSTDARDRYVDRFSFADNTLSLRSTVVAEATTGFTSLIGIQIYAGKMILAQHAPGVDSYTRLHLYSFGQSAYLVSNFEISTLGSRFTALQATGTGFMSKDFIFVARHYRIGYNSFVALAVLSADDLSSVYVNETFYTFALPIADLDFYVQGMPINGIPHILLFRSYSTEEDPTEWATVTDYGVDEFLLSSRMVIELYKFDPITYTFSYQSKAQLPYPTGGVYSSANAGDPHCFPSNAIAPGTLVEIAGDKLPAVTLL